MESSNEYNLYCTEIPEDQKYWFVRTQAGKYFEEFISSSFIAIGWNEITLDLIRKVGDKDKLQKYISTKFPKQRRHGLTATHMIRFVNEMGIGDIVVIPSQSSRRFAFGIITSEPYEENDPFENYQDEKKCDFTKRRKIKWLKNLFASQVDSNLQNIKYAEAAVNSANNYAEYIDRYIGKGLYKKGNIANLVITAGSDNNIKLKDLNDFLTATLSLIQAGCPNIDISNIEIKLNLQSRGKVQIIGAASAIFLLSAGLFIAGKNNFSIKVNIFGCGIETSAEGKTLLQTISDYQDKEIEREFKKLQLEREKLKVEALKESQKKKDENDEKEKGIFQLKESQKNIHEIKKNIYDK